MYKKFSSNEKDWSFELLTESLNAEGGLKEASASINGSSVFAHLKVRFFTILVFTTEPLASSFSSLISDVSQFKINYKSETQPMYDKYQDFRCSHFNF